MGKITYSRRVQCGMVRPRIIPSLHNLAQHWLVIIVVVAASSEVDSEERYWNNFATCALYMSWVASYVEQNICHILFFLLLPLLPFSFFFDKIKQNPWLCILARLFNFSLCRLTTILFCTFTNGLGEAHLRQSTQRLLRRPPNIKVLLSVRNGN